MSTLEQHYKEMAEYWRKRALEAEKKNKEIIDVTIPTMQSQRVNAR